MPYGISGNHTDDPHYHGQRFGILELLHLSFLPQLYLVSPQFQLERRIVEQFGAMHEFHSKRQNHGTPQI